MIKRKRGRRKRIRFDRIFLVLIIIIIIVSIIKFINYIRYNNKVYNNVVNSNAVDVAINKKYNKLKLYNKTIDLIKSDNVSIVINDKKTNTYLSSKNVKKNMNLKVNTYNQKLKYKNFPNVKSFFIENTGIIKKSDKVEIKLPRYLTKNNIVDIYGVKKDNTVNEIYLSEKVKNGKVNIKPNKNYKKYFITYIKLDDIKVKNMTVNKGSVVNLNIEYIPSVATVRDFEYTKIGDIFMLNDNERIVAKKTGTDKITIRHKVQNIEKTITIKVKKEENKIEEKDGITYVNGILIANKTYSLPSSYDPGKINEDASNAFQEMKEAAKKDGINLYISSGYRSYETQKEIYNYYVEKDGKEKADTYSARPGHSEHQSGLAMDLNIIDSSFEGTPEAIWIAENCYKYGFIIRYPKGKDKVTGYKYEPWHIRYLGKEIAKKVYDSGLTLEEYLGIDSKYKD